MPTLNAAVDDVVTLDASRAADWDRYIATAPGAVCAHQRAWAAVVEETYGHEPAHLMAYREDQLVGVLPLVVIRSRLFGRAVVSSPFLTYGGLLADDAAAAEALVHAAIDLARTRRAHYLELRNHTAWPGRLQNKTKYQTLTLDLAPGEERLWMHGIHRGARHNVRIAQRQGLRVVSGHEHLDAFADIFTQNMRRLGTPAHGLPFFRNVLKHFPSAVLLMACKDEQFIGGNLLLGFRDTMEMPWAGSLAAWFKQCPNDLLYWESITTACRAGYSRFDFGRSKQDSGTWRFKVRYGGRPVPLTYQYHLGGARAMPDVDPDNARYRMLIATWRRLPLSVVRRVGPRLIASIP